MGSVSSHKILRSSHAQSSCGSSHESLPTAGRPAHAAATRNPAPPALPSRHRQQSLKPGRLEPLRRRGAGAAYPRAAARALAASWTPQAQWAASLAANGAMCGEGDGSSCGGGCAGACDGGSRDGGGGGGGGGGRGDDF